MAKDRGKEKEVIRVGSAFTLFSGFPGTPLRHADNVTRRNHNASMVIGLDHQLPSQDVLGENLGGSITGQNFAADWGELLCHFLVGFEFVTQATF